MKLGDGNTIPTAQLATDTISKYDVVADLTIGIGIPLPVSNEIPGVGVQAGITEISSFDLGDTNTYVHTGGNVGYSLLPISLTYSVGMVENFNYSSDYEGPAYSISANGIYGGAYSSWFTSNVKTYTFSISTNPGASVGIDYFWDVGGK